MLWCAVNENFSSPAVLLLLVQSLKVAKMVKIHISYSFYSSKRFHSADPHRYSSLLNQSHDSPCSRLLQLFDEDNPLHKSDNKYIFTTEGHVVPIDRRFRERQWSSLFPLEEGALAEREPNDQPTPSNITKVRPPSFPKLVTFSVAVTESVFPCSATGSQRSGATLCH